MLVVPVDENDPQLSDTFNGRGNLAYVEDPAGAENAAS